MCIYICIYCDIYYIYIYIRISDMKDARIMSYPHCSVVFHSPGISDYDEFHHG